MASDFYTKATFVCFLFCLFVRLLIAVFLVFVFCGDYDAVPLLPGDACLEIIYFPTKLLKNSDVTNLQ